MSAETIFSMMVSILCIAPVIILGIVQYRSENPVGFWSGYEPPKKEEITDITAYNHRHGMMWIVYGVGFLVCILPTFFAEAEWIINLSIAVTLTEGIGGIFVLIACHNKWVRKYQKHES